MLHQSNFSFSCSFGKYLPEHACKIRVNRVVLSFELKGLYLDFPQQVVTHILHVRLRLHMMGNQEDILQLGRMCQGEESIKAKKLTQYEQTMME